MRYLVWLILLGAMSSCKAQKPTEVRFTYANFAAEVLHYQPVRKDAVSEKAFAKGLFKLEETKKAVENDPANFTYADYWNIAMAFLNFSEPNEHVKIAFQKATEADASRVCDVLQSFGNSSLDEKIPDALFAFLATCADDTAQAEINVAEYAATQNLHEGLLTLIKGIHANDVKYRFDDPVDWTKQKPLDRQNQQLIDSLYNHYQTYVGRSLVGDEFEYVMWAVIQHANPGMMERYLPVVQKAVAENELSVGPLKMLLDRYYGLKHGYQIFGTQSGFGFELANDETRAAIEAKYGIE